MSSQSQITRKSVEATTRTSERFLTKSWREFVSTRRKKPGGFQTTHHLASNITSVLLILSFLWLPSETLADDSNLVDTGMSLVENVVNLLREKEFADAKQLLEQNPTAISNPALTALIDLEQARKKLLDSADCSNLASSQKFFDELKDWEIDLRMAAANGSEDYATNYVVAISAAMHFSLVNRHLLFAGDQKSGISRKDRNTFLVQNGFSGEILPESVMKCAALNGSNPEMLLLRGVLLAQLDDRNGPKLIHQALKQNPNDFFVLAYFAEHLNAPSIIRNNELLEQYMLVLRRQIFVSRDIVEFAHQKHQKESHMLREDFVRAGTHGFPSQYLLEVSSDSKKAMFLF